MNGRYEVLLVSINNNLVRAILATDLNYEAAWVAVETYGKQLDCSQSFVIDDLMGNNEIGRPFKGFMPAATAGFSH